MVLIEEVWVSVPIQGLEHYEVSSYGRVINKERGNELRPSPDKNGYLRVGLSYKGNVKFFQIHRLVAEAFFLNYKSGIEVKHKNNDLNDNSVLNLTLGGGCRGRKEDV